MKKGGRLNSICFMMMRGATLKNGIGPLLMKETHTQIRGFNSICFMMMRGATLKNGRRALKTAGGRFSLLPGVRNGRLVVIYDDFLEFPEVNGLS